MDLLSIIWIFFIIVNWVNISQSLNFFLRVKGGARGEKIEHLLGYITVALGIISFTVGIIVLVEEFEFFHIIGAFVYTAFCILCFVVDYWKKIEFRNPKKLKIVIPYLLLYYYSLLMMTLSIRQLGLFPWILTSILLFFQIGMAYYAGKHGKG